MHEGHPFAGIRAPLSTAIPTAADRTDHSTVHSAMSTQSVTIASPKPLSPEAHLAAYLKARGCAVRVATASPEPVKVDGTQLSAAFMKFLIAHLEELGLKIEQVEDLRGMLDSACLRYNTAQLKASESVVPLAMIKGSTLQAPESFLATPVGKAISRGMAEASGELRNKRVLVLSTGDDDEPPAKRRLASEAVMLMEKMKRLSDRFKSLNPAVLNGLRGRLSEFEAIEAAFDADRTGEDLEASKRTLEDLTKLIDEEQAKVDAATAEGDQFDQVLDMVQRAAEIRDATAKLSGSGRAAIDDELDTVVATMQKMRTLRNAVEKLDPAAIAAIRGRTNNFDAIIKAFEANRDGDNDLVVYERVIEDLQKLVAEEERKEE